MTAEHQEQAFRIWDALTAFPPSEAEAALNFLFEEISRVIRADNVFWLSSMRMYTGQAAAGDPLRGWRLRAMEIWRSEPGREERFKRFEAMMENQEPAQVIGHTTIKMAETAGQFRVFRLRDGWIDYEEFVTTEHFEIYYRKPGIDDRLWVVYPVSENVESFFAFDRVRTEERFTEEEAAFAGFVLRGLMWFHRLLALGRGFLVASSPLTGAERRELKGLLTGRSEKEVAHHLGITTGTAHNYVVQIFRKYGVRSRAELTTLWLGGTTLTPLS